jgi:hypothetical protein
VLAPRRVYDDAGKPRTRTIASDYQRVPLRLVLLMNQWAASAVVIDGVSFRWPKAVPLLTSRKGTEAIDIVIAAAAFAQSALEINGRAQENHYREVLTGGERLLLTCRNAAALIEDLDLKNVAAAQSKINGGLLGKLRACLHRMIAADRRYSEPGDSAALESFERTEVTAYPRDLEADTATVLIAEIFDLAYKLYRALPQQNDTA